jgi:large subunit ribosomal protein L10
MCGSLRESLCQTFSEAKTFYLKGGERTLAISKKRKEELVDQYQVWLKDSKAVILTEYVGLTMPQIDDLRRKVRDAGGEFHIIKNTLGKVAFEEAGLHIPEKLLEGSTAAAFAFQDAPVMAKIVNEFARTSEFVKVKGGFLEKQNLSSADVKALADLPPLPIVRAQLLGVLSAPASKLVRTLAEPARQVASVFKSYADKDTAPATA